MTRVIALLACAASIVAPAAAQPAFDCMIEARQTVEIRSSVEAVIETVKVQRGNFVSKGQVIATLEPGAERAARAPATRARTTFPRGASTSRETS